MATKVGVIGAGGMLQYHAPGFRQGGGDLVAIAPEERHWHGASPDGPMTHIAINLDATTSWFDPVSDDDYAGG